jgi:hypothetical protein
MENLRQQFENLSRQEPAYHSMRAKLVEALSKKDPELPEEKKHFDHAKKADGMNGLGKEDGFTGQMQDLQIMLADIDQKITEKTGKESNLKETLLNGVFETIRQQLSEV